nr:putative atpase yjob [Quercus suber]
MSINMEPFTLIEESSGSKPYRLFDDVVELNSAKTADHDIQYVVALREANPEMIVTCVPGGNIPLLAFASAGFATFELDTKTDSFTSLRGYVAPTTRTQKGRLAEAVSFAKYHYNFGDEDFILYCVKEGFNIMQYVLKERKPGEGVYGPSAPTDTLIKAVGDWLLSDEDVVWVYDNFWRKNKQLFQEVQKASWDKVILNESMKQELTQVTNKFFDSKDIYEDLGVPWKRGLMFHGPPGNGKTISIKALMHTLLNRKHSIPTLYVKTAPNTYHIQNVFSFARRQSPCMLILEDVETIVTPQTRSYFFNEMDGLENNDGLFVVASTNFLERLDPGLTKRPSRFDRKYLFPLPNEHERTLYCEYWRRKLSSNPKIEFPLKLCPAMAHVTPGFSFAFMQECFVATMLVLARGEDVTLSRRSRDNDPGLDDYELWVVFRKQAELLRKEVEGSQQKMQAPSDDSFPVALDGGHYEPTIGRGVGLGSTLDPSSQDAWFDEMSRGWQPHEADMVAGAEDMILERHLAGMSLAELPTNFQKKAWRNSASTEYQSRARLHRHLPVPATRAAGVRQESGADPGRATTVQVEESSLPPDGWKDCRCETLGWLLAANVNEGRLPIWSSMRRLSDTVLHGGDGGAGCEAKINKQDVDSEARIELYLASASTQIFRRPEGRDPADMIL